MDISCLSGSHGWNRSGSRSPHLEAFSPHTGAVPADPGLSTAPEQKEKKSPLDLAPAGGRTAPLPEPCGLEHEGTDEEKGGIRWIF